MKYIKLFALSLLALGFASCSNDDDKVSYNTDSNVTVSMEKTDISFGENKGLVYVPVKVTGTTNGILTVTCTVEEVTDQPKSEPAMEDVHYLMTAMSINIAEGDSIGNFEIKLVDDAEINDARLFKITLANCEGGKIAGVTETIVTIKDNDSDPYLRLGGEWFVPCCSWDGSPAATRTVRFITYDEGEEDETGAQGYYKFYHVEGLLDGTLVKAKFRYDEATDEGEVTFEYGQKLDSFTSDGTTYDGELAYFYMYNGDGPYLDDEGTAAFTWTDEARTALNIVSFAGSDMVNYDGAGFAYLLTLGGSPASYIDECAGVTGFYRTKP